jgi:hypothetical protein
MKSIKYLNQPIVQIVPKRTQPDIKIYSSVLHQLELILKRLPKLFELI